MSNFPISYFVGIILAILVTQFFCADLTNTRRSSHNPWLQLNQSVAQAPQWGLNLDTTPWPLLGQHRHKPQQSVYKPPTSTDLYFDALLNGNKQSNAGGVGTGTGYNNVDDNDLMEFSESLLSKDTNNAAAFVSINYQKKTTSRSTVDQAPLPLLSIRPEAYRIPTVEKLMLLYNNYILESNVAEVYTGQEQNEENNLLNAVLSTPVMQFTREFLINKGKLGRNPTDFKDLMRDIWFNMYSRGRGKIGSSGFEHVFLAEIKNNQVSGLHNWLFFNEEESKNQANYLGYMHKLDLGDKGAILKYHFTFHGIDKPVGSMFIGTSPELEMALYSTCFVLRADHVCRLKMNGHRFTIRTYTYRFRGKNMIGSAFPEI